jgi:hypothetical protein
MGRIRLAASIRARLLVAASGLAVSGGVWLEADPGWALIVGGVLGAGYGLLLMDIDEEG